MADLCQQLRGFETHQTSLTVPPAKIVTDLHSDEEHSNWLKNHGFSFQLFKTFDIAGVSNRRLIYLFDDPIESLISAYHYCNQIPYLSHLSQGSCDSFCASNIENYNLHMNAALTLRAARPDEVLILNAKTISEREPDSFILVHNLLGIPYNHSNSIKALNNCDIDQYVIDKTANTPVTFSSLDFLKPGNELSRHTVDAIVSKLMPVYQDACSVEGKLENAILEERPERLVLSAPL